MISPVRAATDYERDCARELARLWAAELEEAAAAAIAAADVECAACGGSGGDDDCDAPRRRELVEAGDGEKPAVYRWTVPFCPVCRGERRVQLPRALAIARLGLDARLGEAIRDAEPWEEAAFDWEAAAYARAAIRFLRGEREAPMTI